MINSPLPPGKRGHWECPPQGTKGVDWAALTAHPSEIATYRSYDDWISGLSVQLDVGRPNNDVPQHSCPRPNDLNQKSAGILITAARVTRSGLFPVLAGFTIKNQKLKIRFIREMIYCPRPYGALRLFLAALDMRKPAYQDVMKIFILSFGVIQLIKSPRLGVMGSPMRRAVMDASSLAQHGASELSPFPGRHDDAVPLTFIGVTPAVEVIPAYLVRDCTIAWYAPVAPIAPVAPAEHNRNQRLSATAPPFKLIASKSSSDPAASHATGQETSAEPKLDEGNSRRPNDSPKISQEVETWEAMGHPRRISRIRGTKSQLSQQVEQLQSQIMSLRAHLLPVQGIQQKPGIRLLLTQPPWIVPPVSNGGWEKVSKKKAAKFNKPTTSDLFQNGFHQADQELEQARESLDTGDEEALRKKAESLRDSQDDSSSNNGIIPPENDTSTKEADDEKVESGEITSKAHKPFKNKKKGNKSMVVEQDIMGNFDLLESFLAGSRPSSGEKNGKGPSEQKGEQLGKAQKPTSSKKPKGKKKGLPPMEKNQENGVNEEVTLPVEISVGSNPSLAESSVGQMFEEIFSHPERFAVQAIDQSWKRYKAPSTFKLNEPNQETRSIEFGMQEKLEIFGRSLIVSHAMEDKDLMRKIQKFLEIKLDINEAFRRISGEYGKTFDIFGHYGLSKINNKFQINKEYYVQKPRPTPDMRTKYTLYVDYFGEHEAVARSPPTVHFQWQDFHRFIDHNGEWLKTIKENVYIWYMSKVLYKVLSVNQYNHLPWHETPERKWLITHPDIPYLDNFQKLLAKLKNIKNLKKNDVPPAVYPPSHPAIPKFHPTPIYTSQKRENIVYLSFVKFISIDPEIYNVEGLPPRLLATKLESFEPELSKSF
ncbi:hypothetical protein PSTT_05896 [Puccinia striiformis]|uniref:Uncharacterized protein n=1 Tax=Puccinia striiformis TaxID=27350 RepID=A0A2S4VM78_9BASI|nr:hypothetical protein PSTT_05896 [Puccinia striiformis]